MRNTYYQQSYYAVEGGSIQSTNASKMLYIVEKNYTKFSYFPDPKKEDRAILKAANQGDGFKGHSRQLLST